MCMKTRYIYIYKWTGIDEQNGIDEERDSLKKMKKNVRIERITSKETKKNIIIEARKVFHCLMQS